MGLVSNWMIEQQERGYNEADGDICPNCVNDPALKAWVSNNLSATECSFCQRESEEAIAANFDDFMGIVLEGVWFDWNSPEGEGIMYITREGGFQARLSDSYDVFGGYDISDCADVVETIIDSVDNTSWVQRDFYRGDEGQRLGYAWRWFKHVTMHQSRFLFLKHENEQHEDDIPPAWMLGIIGDVIVKQLAQYPLIKTLSEATDLYRIRVAPEPYGTAAAIGTPPVQFATQANRMSPAGIPMFYCAYQIETAKAETIDPAHHAGQVMSIGRFQPSRPLRVLDLAELPDIPSVFAEETRHLIHPMRFLHEFTADLVKRIARDGCEHIEYVPTQIVTEYFRRMFRDAAGQSLDGLVYGSSREEGGKALVLFCENDQCAEPGGDLRKAIVQLHTVSHEVYPGESPPA